MASPAMTTASVEGVMEFLSRVSQGPRVIASELLDWPRTYNTPRLQTRTDSWNLATIAVSQGAMPRAEVCRRRDIYPASRRRACPSPCPPGRGAGRRAATAASTSSACPSRSEEHTSELQSHSDLVCRLLLEKKNKKKQTKR